MLSLLTINNANKIPHNILKCNTDWWLSSPGKTDDLAAYIDGDLGYIVEYGFFVTNTTLGVRPILKLSKNKLKKLPVTNHGTVLYGTDQYGASYEWFDISQYINESCLLMKECVLDNMKYGETNIYETSDIKKYLEKLKDQILK